MRLISAQVQGFQSFSDSGEVKFSEGINLIIGQNNAGKSAFLRSLLAGLPDDRHRTPEKWESFRLPSPLVLLTVEVSGKEIRDLALQTGSQQFFPVSYPLSQNVVAFMEELFELPELKISVNNCYGSAFSASYPSHGLFHYESGAQQMCAVTTPHSGELSISPEHRTEDTLPLLLWNAWQRDMFFFVAERLTIGECAGGHATRLVPNAANLPNVLHTLNSERGDVFKRLVSYLRDVFSSVGNLSVRTKPGTQNLEILVWPTEAMERPELSFPLNSSGTGVSQVIALLTAVMTIENAVVIIDEINSFLHPAAVKALLRILQTQYADHQYIISTHAPEVIGFSNPKTIHLVKRSGYESSIQALNLDNVENFREVADHLGVSMADVFAAERVVWVEGPTEELCFPYLYQELVGPLPRGTIITSVAATGDFNTKKRDPAIVYEVYQRLSSASATLVVSVAFSFDTEKLSDSEKTEMMRNSKGLLHFLPRRHFECYLLDPHAITAFIITKDPTLADTVTPEAVELALQKAAAERSWFVPEWNGDISDTEWLSKVDAANLIKATCGALSDHRVPFTKKDDSLFLLKYLVENDQLRLAPLRDYVKGLVEAAV